METIDALNNTLRTYLDSEQTAAVNRAYFFAETRRDAHVNEGLSTRATSRRKTGEASALRARL